MKIGVLVCCAATLGAPAALAWQAQNEDRKFQEIRQKRMRGDKITEEERDYGESMIERQNQEASAKRYADYAKAHPPRESTGLVPLAELGKGEWMGRQGGLYPGGSNTAPAGHREAGLRMAAAIEPLDRDGRKSPDGKIVMCAIGMSNGTQEARSFLKLLPGKSGLNPKLTFVDCAQGSQTASKIQDPNFPYWKLVLERLRNADVTPAQVQAVWIKEADGGPGGPADAYAGKFREEMTKVMHNLHDLFPNLKIAYISDRIYGGYAGTPLNPEPYAYASGFAVKWLIADQIEGKPELNYDPAKGPVRSPWMTWGPRLWADGMKPRADGLVWKRDDLGPDGTHPSMLGRDKVARMLMAFLENEATSCGWFLAPGRGSAAGSR